VESKSTEARIDETRANQGPESGPDAPPIPEADIDLLLGMIRQMAEFLKDPVAFAKSVSEGPNPPPEDWQDVSEMMARDPILGQQEGEWYWPRDFFGIPQKPPQPPQSEQAVVASKAGDGKLGATVLEVQGVIGKIRGIQSAVSEYTEERLNLDQLGSELRLLEISPDYVTFERTAQSYLANAGPGPEESQYASLSTDRLVLQQYHGMLDRCWPSVKWTFFIAQLLCIDENHSASTTRDRNRAVRLIAEELDFSRLTTEQLLAMLTEFEHDLAEIDPSGQHHRAAFDAVMDIPLDEGWLRVLPLRVETEPPLWTAAGFSAQVSNYYRSRFKALILHLRNGKPLRRLTLSELATRFRTQVAPFHGDPNAMTLATYADALFQAGPAAVIPAFEFVYACAVKLGFGPQISTMSLPMSQEDALDLREAAERVIRSGERVLLILGKRPTTPIPGKREPSLAQTWTVSQRHAVFPVNSDFSWLPDLNRLDFSLVLFEDTPPDTLEGWRKQGIIGPNAKIVELVKSREGKTGPLVVQPKDLDDAVAQALRPEPMSPAA
jgi:hypothetical protein